MRLYSDRRDDVAEILSDPDICTGDIKIRRTLDVTAGANPWNPPTPTYQIIQLDAVAFSGSAKFSAGTLVTERGVDLTVAGWATIVEENSLPRNTRIPLDIIDTDEFLVDGDPRRVISVERVPEAGNVASVWLVRVAD